MAGVQNGTSRWPREVAFQGRGGQLCLMRPSQVEEEEGWGQAIKFNDLGDSFSWVMGQTPGWRELGDKLVVGLVKGRRKIRDSFKQRPGQGKEFWGESVVRRRLKIKKGLMTYIMWSTWMRWFSFSAWFWWALPELSWQVRKQGGRGSTQTAGHATLTGLLGCPLSGQAGGGWCAVIGESEILQACLRLSIFFFILNSKNFLHIPSKFFFYLYWGIIDKAIIYLTYTVWWFDITYFVKGFPQLT